LSENAVQKNEMTLTLFYIYHNICDKDILFICFQAVILKLHTVSFV